MDQIIWIKCDITINKDFFIDGENKIDLKHNNNYVNIFTLKKILGH